MTLSSSYHGIILILPWPHLHLIIASASSYHGFLFILSYIALSCHGLILFLPWLHGLSWLHSNIIMASSSINHRLILILWWPRFHLIIALSSSYHYRILNYPGFLLILTWTYPHLIMASSPYHGFLLTVREASSSLWTTMSSIKFLPSTKSRYVSCQEHDHLNLTLGRRMNNKAYSQLSQPVVSIV